jgi:zinc protease
MIQTRKRIVRTLMGLIYCSSMNTLYAEQKNDLIDDIEGDHSMITRHCDEKVKKDVVHKKVLSNGMTVLVKTVRRIPEVVIQVWYHVGSKDERSGERGLAHLIEHMIFKGTQLLSESDINTITHKLSGKTNAFTSYDYTGYLFNLPSQHWQEALPIMADCMQNVSFKEDHLNSEMKAVIQELKMNRDNYGRSALMELIAAIFPDHPYHHPVIGYKQDLWSVHARDLRAFYKKHYLPNNAVLVVVGDVNPDEVFAKAQQYFGDIKPNEDYKKEQFYYNQDIVAKSVTLYRDIKQPIGMMTFVVPGMKHKNSHIWDVISLVLGTGKASRLYRKLVDELHLATSFSAGSWSLFDYNLFFLMYEPASVENIPAIEAYIAKELEEIARCGIEEHELVRAVKKAKMDYFDMLESSQQQARDIGLYYLATGDENYAFDYLNEPIKVLQERATKLIGEYCRPSVAHTAYVLPLPESERSVWRELQRESDEEDAAILAARARTSPVEKPSYAHKVNAKDQPVFDYPKAQTLVASNALKVLYADNQITPKIDLVMEFKAKYYYDPHNKQGLSNFVAKMLSEGTKNYSAVELAHELESRGMSFSAYPGGISMSMLSSDLEKGLELLQEMLSNATFDPQEIEKVRQQLLADINQFWDDPRSFAAQLVKEHIYKGHPYHKNALGTKESIESITQEDLINFYHKAFSPYGAKLAMVGDLKGYDLAHVIEKHLAPWVGDKVEDIKFPALKSPAAHEFDYYINRDQVLLYFAGLSVARTDKDYDKLLLFDQIFGGGVLGSMHSRLFALREQSGLFYTISGSLTTQANEQPGMATVRTLVSMDRVEEAEKVIKQTINHAADKVTDQEFNEARSAIANALINNFESNAHIAQSFLFLDRYGFAPDYFDTRAQQLAKIRKEDMQQAVKNFLNTNKMIILKVGRVGKKSCAD